MMTFFKCREREYTLYSANGNMDVIDFKPAFHDQFIKAILGPDICLYEIYFENITKDLPADPGIEKMVGEILRHFMQGHGNAVAYYSISRLDGRNPNLFRLYSIWFNNMCRKTDSSLRKIDRKIIENTVVIDHISCLFQKGLFWEKYMFVSIANCCCRFCLYKCKCHVQTTAHLKQYN